MRQAIQEKQNEQKQRNNCLHRGRTAYPKLPSVRTHATAVTQRLPPPRPRRGEPDPLECLWVLTEAYQHGVYRIGEDKTWRTKVVLIIVSRLQGENNVSVIF